jgi:Glycosyl transferases group 1
MKNDEGIQKFKEKHGRPPRILHIGNIANNAYNNVKLLQKCGFDCDVICYDYYHVMGTPEWEDADFDGAVKDQFYPDWSGLKLNGFKRPRWFAQGPQELCLKYLIAKRAGMKRSADYYWKVLSIANKTSKMHHASSLYYNVKSFYFTVKQYLRVLLYDRDIINTADRYIKTIDKDYLPFALISLPMTGLGILFIALLLRVTLLPAFVFHNLYFSAEESDNSFNTVMKDLIGRFSQLFPDRQDKLVSGDLEVFRPTIALWKELFKHYDLIQAYATDPALPLLAGKKPYIGFEHGTLRDFTIGNSRVCRVTSLAYRLADHVFVTNGDCVEYARRLGITKSSAMLHPIDEQRIRKVEGCYDQVHSKYGVKNLFLCTLRHEWNVKGTDIYIRALPAMLQTIGKDFRMIMTEWGTQVKDSKALAEELGISEFIIWMKPLNRLRLIRMLKSVDVLFDQIALPHFGATAPEGIAAGVPVIMSYDPKSTEWIVPEPAPILSAWCSEDVVQNVQKALDPEWLKDYRIEAERWFDRCHASERVVRLHTEVYARLLNKMHQDSLGCN